VSHSHTWQTSRSSTRLYFMTFIALTILCPMENAHATCASCGNNLPPPPQPPAHGGRVVHSECPWLVCPTPLALLGGRYWRCLMKDCFSAFVACWPKCLAISCVWNGGRICGCPTHVIYVHACDWCPSVLHCCLLEGQIPRGIEEQERSCLRGVIPSPGKCNGSNHLKRHEEREEPSPHANSVWACGRPVSRPPCVLPCA
jgi:hypothetical protein